MIITGPLREGLTFQRIVLNKEPCELPRRAGLGVPGRGETGQLEQPHVLPILRRAMRSERNK